MVFAMSQTTTESPVVVGLGSSAGGLEALKRFFLAMPRDSGAAFVVVPHLDPHHESLMVDLLSRCTEMPVVQVEDGAEVAADHVYIIPPNKYLRLGNGKLELSPPTARRGMRMAIDTFFRSLAQQVRKRAIGVVLSGTGTDGTLGIKAIKEHGGLVLVQNPDDATHDGMPRSAIATELADRTLAVDEMPEVISAFIRHPYINEEQKVDTDPDTLKQILAVLRAQSRQDFRFYKPTTLTRRIERRMGLAHIERLENYVEFLRSNRDEVEQLGKDFLIGVTGFFRESEAFKVLEHRVLPVILGKKTVDDTVRVWVPACSTGEEAYSVTMLIMELLNRQSRQLRVQVYATDIDVQALEVARNGVYPESAIADLPPEYVRQFFKKQGDFYHVNKDLREAVVFAQQNLITDPPFSRVDLVSCRNLLIYLKPEYQTRVLQLFHFALVQDGYLVLGPSETVGSLGSLFHTVSKKWRVYQRIGSRRRPVVDFPSTAGEVAQVRRSAPKKRTLSFREAARDALLEAYAPPSVVVSRTGEVEYYIGDTTPYLSTPQGPPTQDIVALVRGELRGRVRTALLRAVRENKLVASAPSNRIIVSIRPFPIPEREQLYLLSFTEQPDKVEPAEIVVDDDAGSLIKQLERELESTREDLQSTIEEFETSNEELKASNEEVMSMNEELQSTNEELETSKEELQSLNEDLSTVNTQLQEKVLELEASNNDINNLLASTEIATIFLDRCLRIKRFTPTTTKLMNVIRTDIGRPLTDIAGALSTEKLEADALDVLGDLQPRKREIKHSNGHWYRRRIAPYRTEDDRILGLVVTLVDVNESKLAELALRDRGELLEEKVRQRTVDLQEAVHLAEDQAKRASQAEKAHRLEHDRLQTVLDTAVDAIITIDERGRVETANRATERMFGYTASELVGHNISKLMPDNGYLQNYRRTEEKKLIGQGRTVEARRADGSTFPVELAIGESATTDGVRFTGILRDISQRHRLEAEFRQVQKLEAIGRLSSGIAHDFNNVLMGINGLAQVLIKQLQDNLDARSIAEDIERETRLSTSLTRQLLMFSRRSAHSNAITDITQAIREMRSMIERLVGDHIDVSWQLPDVPTRVRCDVGRVEQVVMNLVINAKDAMPSGGRLDIAIHSPVEPTGSTRKRNVILEIRDNGCGIEEATREHMFEPFFSTKDESIGTGLGLSTVYGIVADSKGHIEVDSTPGDGTTIRIYFPECTDTPVEPEEQTSEQQLDSTTVLVIEDHPQVRALVELYLSEAGHTVFDAEDGVAAEKILSTTPVDAIISDVVLPGESGPEFVQRVASDIPTVFMSAYPREQLVREGRIKEGALSLQKPFDAKSLLKSLHNALQGDAPSGND